MAYAAPFKRDGFECCESIVPEDDESLLIILEQLAIGDFRGAFLTYFTNQLIGFGRDEGLEWARNFRQELDAAIKEAF